MTRLSLFRVEDRASFDGACLERCRKTQDKLLSLPLQE